MWYNLQNKFIYIYIFIHNVIDKRIVTALLRTSLQTFLNPVSCWKRWLKNICRTSTGTLLGILLDWLASGPLLETMSGIWEPYRQPCPEPGKIGWEAPQPARKALLWLLKNAGFELWEKSMFWFGSELFPTRSRVEWCTVANGFAWKDYASTKHR